MLAEVRCICCQLNSCCGVTKRDQRQVISCQGSNRVHQHLQQLWLGRCRTCSLAIIVCSYIHTSLWLPILQVIYA